MASNIVQGIGFLGAGLILHNRSRVSGLTSAASVWVVASIGMACGAGLYAAAVVAAVIVMIALELVGILERRANIKGYPLVYEARGQDQTLMLTSILDAMDKAGERLSNVERDAIGELQRVSFALTATSKQHERVPRSVARRTGYRRAIHIPRPGGRLISFTKAHACGNDFLIVTEEAARGRDWAALTRRLCARNTGIGADGIEFFAWTGDEVGPHSPAQFGWFDRRNQRQRNALRGGVDGGSHRREGGRGRSK